jgi:DUF4097 and DUF4098 domain-containing protein YvlB
MTPARWVTLAIGVPVLLTLIGWIGFTVVDQSAHGSFPVNYAGIPVQHGQLSVSVNSGDVTVRQAQGATARLTGTVRYGLFRPSLSTSTTASGTEVDVNCSDVNSGNCGLSGTLDVPPLTSLTLSSGGGNLTVPDVARSVSLTSDGGDVAVSGIPGLAAVSTGGGNLTAGDLAGPMQFTTDGGDINGNDLTAPSLNAGSGGGNVTVVFTSVPANLAITSDGGDITIELPQGPTAYYVTSSSDGGDDSVSVPTSPNPKAANKINVDSGGGNISITDAS